MTRSKYFLVAAAGFSLLLTYCKNSDTPKEKGEALAQQYCQSCHLLPDPSLLDAKTWREGVLPNMGPMLGIFNHGFQQYHSYRHDRLLDTNFYPRQPVLSPVDWQYLIDYYAAAAPDSLPPQHRDKKISMGLPLFEAYQPAAIVSPPNTCYVKVRATGRLIFADALSHHIYYTNEQLQVTDSMDMGGPVVDMDFHQNKAVVCDIGVMNPNNGKFGKIKIDTTTIISDLARPVQVTAADLDGDGLQDYLVCEFGFLKGSLTWFQNTGDDHFKRKTIRAFPGALQAILQDVNNDGLPDLWVLFSQGEEGVFLFTNKGGGAFEEKQVLRLPPVYGSTSFELADFNSDGQEDILYTCGDNADYSPVLKPYHGIYIFQNNGKNEFTQHFFFPMNGCYKALARDFDNDGDPDIAAISFFADYARQPEESFVYLDNRQGKYYPLSIPEAVKGRWLTMDAGDLDGDGRTDLVLGNFSKAPAMVQSHADWSKGPAFLYLKNTGKPNN